jgi:hypothetical protein
MGNKNKINGCKVNWSEKKIHVTIKTHQDLGAMPD